MKTWLKQLRELVPGKVWRRDLDKDFWGNVKNTTMVLLLTKYPVGWTQADALDRAADLINTYVLPNFDSNWKYMGRYGCSGSDEGLNYRHWGNVGPNNNLQKRINFALDQDVDKTYTQSEIDELKKQHGAALVDAMELKTKSTQPEEDPETPTVVIQKSDDYGLLLIVIIILIIVVIWMPDK